MSNLQHTLTLVLPPTPRPTESLLVPGKSSPNQVLPATSTPLGLPAFLPRKWWFFILFFIAFAALTNYFNVERTLTNEDRYYIKLYLPNVPADIAPSLSYEDQIKLIQQAQQAVYSRTIGWKGIPEGQPREPKQLYLGRTGLCYDRSRVLEKVFTYLGFTSRHLALFERQPYQHAFNTILFQHIPSHAISEVLTNKGWLMVDSNDLWVSLDSNRCPISMPQMQARYQRNEKINWASSVLKHEEIFFNKRCIALYGLYSRHGRFYPPYISGIPNFRIRGLLYNFEQFGD